MTFELLFAEEADDTLNRLGADKANVAQHKAVNKALRFLKQDPRHPSLNSKRFHTLTGPNNETVYESYAQNRTPGAYRIFWYYKKADTPTIVIAAIEPHSSK